MGLVVSKTFYDAVPYFDKPLFEICGRGFTFSHELKIEFQNGRDTLLYYLDSFAQVFNTLKKLVKQGTIDERAIKINPEDNEQRSFVIDASGCIIHVIHR